MLILHPLGNACPGSEAAEHVQLVPEGGQHLSGYGGGGNSSHTSKIILIFISAL